MIAQRKPTTPRVTYFGIYSTGPAYPRNRNIIDSLRAQGVEVCELHVDVAGSHSQRMQIAGSLGARTVFLFKLALSYLRLSISFCRADTGDILIVGHPGYFHIHLAKFLCCLTRRRPALILDEFIPLFNAVVEDRQLFNADTFMARCLHRFEKSCLSMADLNLLDTRAHCHYIEEQFGVDASRLLAVHVGSSLPVTATREDGAANSFRVVFVGTDIPLHGVETIVEAAALLAQNTRIAFSIVGCSNYSKLHADRPANVEYIDWIEPDQLPAYLASCKLGLGIFGGTSKTQRVIPTKIFDYCSVGLPFITAQTPAIEEVFEHNHNAVLIPAQDSHSLAQAIVALHEDPARLQRLQGEIQSLQTGLFAPEHLAASLLDWFAQR